MSLSRASDAWERALPLLVEAFWIGRGVAPGVDARAREWHAQFVRAYPHEPPVALVVLDPDNWTHPFQDDTR